MNLQTLKQWAAVLAVLSTQDRDVLRRATADRLAAEEALRLATDRETLANKNAAASHEANVRAQRWLSSRSTDEAGFEEGPSEEEVHPEEPEPDTPATESAAPKESPQPSVKTIIMAFLAVVGEATYGEIKAEVNKQRPDVNAANCARDLSRMLRRGLLTKPETGRYRLAARESTTQQS